MSEDFERLLADARQGIEAALAEERREVEPDVAAVVAAAHKRAPERISARAVRDAIELAPVIELARERSSGHELLIEPGLSAFVEAARELAEADASARRLAGIPAAPLPEPAGTQARGGPPEAELSRRRPRRWLAPTLAAAAVLAGLVLAGPRVLDWLLSGASDRSSTSGMAAEYSEREAPAQRAGPRYERVARPPTTAEPTIVEPSVLPPTADETSVADASSESGEAKPGKRDKPKKPSKLRDRVRALDAEAQARWRAGDRKGAHASFRQIIKIAGRSRYADLAYGDLFTLARQRGDRGAELALWREYLECFPKGRFADDARAGVCRRAHAADASKRVACWRRYLDDFPGGAHRRSAERMLER